METKFLEYTLFIKGFFGRNRTLKFESFKIARKETRPELNELNNLALMKLTNIKAKPNARWFVSELEMTEQSFEGYKTVECKPMDSIKLIEGVVP